MNENQSVTRDMNRSAELFVTKFVNEYGINRATAITKMVFSSDMPCYGHNVIQETIDGKSISLGDPPIAVVVNYTADQWIENLKQLIAAGIIDTEKATNIIMERVRVFPGDPLSDDFSGDTTAFVAINPTNKKDPSGERLNNSAVTLIEEGNNGRQNVGAALAELFYCMFKRGSALNITFNAIGEHAIDYEINMSQPDGEVGFWASANDDILFDLEHVDASVVTRNFVTKIFDLILESFPDLKSSISIQNDK